MNQRYKNKIRSHQNGTADPVSIEPPTTTLTRQEVAARHLDRVNRALIWLCPRLPDATTRVVNPEDGLLSVEWRGWSISIAPSDCSEPGDTALNAVIRRGETRHEKVCKNFNHMLNSIKKIYRENR